MHSPIFEKNRLKIEKSVKKSQFSIINAHKRQNNGKKPIIFLAMSQKRMKILPNLMINVILE